MLFVTSLFQVIEFDFSNESNCHYVVVFQYGSVVLFNVSEQKVDGYLKIVENHALITLPERAKDGMHARIFAIFPN